MIARARLATYLQFLCNTTRRLIVARIYSLEELHIERNGLRELPETLGRLKRLRTLNAAHNRLARLPEFLLRPQRRDASGNMRPPTTTTTGSHPNEIMVSERSSRLSIFFAGFQFCGDSIGGCVEVE